VLLFNPQTCISGGNAGLGTWPGKGNSIIVAVWRKYGMNGLGLVVSHVIESHNKLGVA
jgi:hypothetical protein